MASVKKYFILVGLFSLLASSAARGAAAVQAVWDCPHHITNSKVPRSAKIKVELTDEGHLHAPALQQIMQDARAHGGQYNFYNCVKEFMWQDSIYDTLQNHARERDGAADTAAAEASSGSQNEKNLKTSRLALLDEAYDQLQGPGSTTIPGLALGRPLKDHEKLLILEKFKLGGVWGAQALSQEALEEILPQAIDHIYKDYMHNPKEVRQMFQKLKRNLIYEFQSSSQNWGGDPRDVLSKQAFEKAMQEVPYILSFYDEQLLCPKNWSPSVRQMLSLTKILARKPACERLEPKNEVQVLGQADSGGYVLRRLKNNAQGQPVFEAALALRFSVSQSLVTTENMSSEDKREEERKMHDAVQQCLRKYNGKFKGPNGQELRLKVEVVDSTFVSYDVPRPKRLSLPVSDVFIQPAQSRSHMHAWDREADCGTILHETLHHLGLADEYKEKRTGAHLSRQDRRDPYHCRVVGPATSIMNSSGEALEAVCGPGASAPTSPCLDGHDAKRDSLLYPVHFKAITEPGCSTRVHYDQCMAQAYEAGFEVKDATDPRACIKAAKLMCAKLWGSDLEAFLDEHQSHFP